jgi:hypothetical protein
MRPTVLGAVSGCVWAVIAWVLLDQLEVNSLPIAASLLASPLIGILLSRFSKGFRERSILGRTVVALVTLYFAAALFGSVGGMVDLVSSLGMRPVVEPITTAWVFVWGLTFSGYFLVLWPLSYLNHLFVARSYPGQFTESP